MSNVIEMFPGIDSITEDIEALRARLLKKKDPAKAAIYFAAYCLIFACINGGERFTIDSAAIAAATLASKGKHG